MKATLVVNGKEFPIEINDPKLIEEITPRKKTGYERQPGGRYWLLTTRSRVESECDGCCDFDNDCYELANYYSDETVAKNNIRADILMRKLRRFAVEHREKNLEWVSRIAKYYIYYDHNNNRLEVCAK